jgi:hypothetical protein
MLLAYATLPGARYCLENRRKIFDPRFWQFLAGSRPDDVPAGHLVSGLADGARAIEEACND